MAVGAFQRRLQGGEHFPDLAEAGIGQTDIVPVIRIAPREGDGLAGGFDDAERRRSESPDRRDAGAEIAPA